MHRARCNAGPSSTKRADGIRPAFVFPALVIPAAENSDSTGGFPRPGFSDSIARLSRRTGNGWCGDDENGPERERTSRCGEDGEDAGGGAPDSGACSGARRRGSGNGGQDLRHGSPDLARLGASLQQRRRGGSCKPQRGRATAKTERRAEGGVQTACRERAGLGRGQGGALALRGPQAPDREGVQGRSARAHGRQVPQRLGLSSLVGAPAAPEERP